MHADGINKRLPLIQGADLNGKVVLVRVDHNVLKNGEINDPSRIDKTLGTLYYIVDRGGRPIVMSHVGRPLDSKTKTIKCSPETSVKPIAEYLQQKLHTQFFIPECDIDDEFGISGICNSLYRGIGELKDRKIGGIYLPNTRWFRGEEEAQGFFRDNLAVLLSDLADVYVNDAFGSWQAHVSTYDITKFLPSYAGFLMQQEILNLNRVTNPITPFLAIVAGSKFYSKIGPLYTVYEKADYLMLGGIIYNAYLCAKYGISIKGIADEDKDAVKDLVKRDRDKKKILELPFVVESETMEGKIKGKYRTLSVSDFKEGDSYGYVLDIDPKSFAQERVLRSILRAGTIFVDSVMGLTPHFTEGSRALDEIIDINQKTLKLYGSGNTLQELKNLSPGLYISILDSKKYYFFSGGGTVLNAIEKGSPYGVRPIQALMENKARLGNI